jgi:hypothetical protein
VITVLNQLNEVTVNIIVIGHTPLPRENIVTSKVVLRLSAASKRELLLLRDQPSARVEMKPLTYDRGYDNVLLGQHYRTPRGAVIDECRASVNKYALLIITGLSCLNLSLRSMKET